MHCCNIGEAIYAAETYPSYGIPSLFSILAPCAFFLFPTTKTLLKRAFWIFGGGPAALCHMCLKLYWKMFSRNASKCDRKE
jgi:hypothetical protein